MQHPDYSWSRNLSFESLVVNFDTDLFFLALRSPKNHAFGSLGLAYPQQIVLIADSLSSHYGKVTSVILLSSSTKRIHGQGHRVVSVTLHSLPVCH